MNGFTIFVVGFVVALALAAVADHYILHISRRQLIADFAAWKTNAGVWFAAELAKAKTEMRSVVPGGNAADNASAAQAGAATATPTAPKGNKALPRKRKS